MNITNPTENPSLFLSIPTPTTSTITKPKKTTYEGTFEAPNLLATNYHYIHLVGSTFTVFAIGGDGGGFEGPSYSYDRLAETLENFNVSLLRIDVKPNYKHAAEQMELGLGFLRDLKHFNPLILIGWSMGGASIMNLAKKIAENEDKSFAVKALISIAGQPRGADVLKELNYPVYLFHGDKDKVLKVSCVEYYVKWAKDCRKKVIIKGGTHCMDVKGDGEVFVGEFFKVLNEICA